MPAATPPSPRAFSPDAAWVRVLERRPSGTVEFQFAVGDPELFVELAMSGAAFEEFCAMHRVAPSDGARAPAPDEAARELDWSLRDARARRPRHEP